MLHRSRALAVCGLIAAAFASLHTSALAQEIYEPSASNVRTREWFQEARFGLFIHWGTYAVRGDGEWVMQNQRITIPEYERDLPPAFNPIKFDAAAWVAAAKAAGLRYVTITSKHHGGFAMCEGRLVVCSNIIHQGRALLCEMS